MSKIVYKKYSVDKKNLSALFLVLFWLLLFVIICFVGLTNVNALTFDTYDVTWYYRNQSDESTLKNVVKDQSTPLYAGTGEYVNGFTTRIESTFTKDVQYIVNYKLQMYYYIGEDGNFRSDTIDRIIKYSWVDSDFKLLNTTATQTEYDCQSANLCIRTFNISQQVLTLNDTTAIRFGVYTTDNISIGFYNHNQEIDYIFLNDIFIENNANATIIDQNNQIISGQDGINDNITNSTNTITGSITETEDNINSNIDDMESAILDSNKETQEVIKDQFNDCRDGYNLLKQPYLFSNSFTSNGLTITLNDDYSITVTGKATSTYYLNLNYFYKFNSSIYNNNSIQCKDGYCLSTGLDYNVSNNLVYITFNNGFTYNKTYYPMITTEKNKNVAYEKYTTEEICSNKLDEQNETSKGIWATIKDLPNMFLDMLLGLFIPEDLSFIDNFKEVISNKLGFIASIPIQIIDFMLGLANIAFDEITTISFPSISIFGFNFWNAEEIDITIMLEKLKPFRYFTDLTCVILCCRTLYDLYHNFTGGGAN